MRLRHWVGAAIVAASLSVGSPAWSQAQTYTGVTPPVVSADDNAPRTTPSTAPAGRGDLAVTGADVMEMVAIGAFATSAGALGLRIGRARPKPVPA